MNIRDCTMSFYDSSHRVKNSKCTRFRSRWVAHEFFHVENETFWRHKFSWLQKHHSSSEYLKNNVDCLFIFSTSHSLHSYSWSFISNIIATRTEAYQHISSLFLYAYREVSQFWVCQPQFTFPDMMRKRMNNFSPSVRWPCWCHS